jgi:hypothetical protein
MMGRACNQALWLEAYSRHVPARAGGSWTLVLRFLIVLWVLACPGRANAEPSALLVTVGPGEPLWTRFGHIALRIVDADAGTDDVYGFGSAPFDEPGFVLDQLRGHSRFWLEFETWDEFLELYLPQDRTIRVRPLALAPSQAQQLAHRLAVNALPANRAYRYDHLADNCSTRVRDALDAVTSGALRRAARTRASGWRYRDHTLAAAAGDVPAQLGMDLIGGPNQERRPNAWQEAYLPARLERLVLAATNVVDGRRVPLAGPALTPHVRQAPAPSGGRWSARYVLLGAWLAVALLVAVAGRRAGWLARLAGAALGTASLASALVGAALWTVVAISPLPDFRWNENVLALVPFDLALLGPAIRWARRGAATIGPRTRRYVLARLAVLAGLVVLKLVGVCRQDDWIVLASVAAVLVAVACAPATPTEPEKPAATVRRRGRRGRGRS